MSLHNVAFLLGEIAGVIPDGSNWDAMEYIKNNKKYDAEMKSRFRKVDKLIREEHFKVMGQQYPGYKSSVGDYPARRTGDLQGSFLTTMLLPQKGTGARTLRMEYMADVATHKGYYYPKKLFSTSGNKNGGRKNVENLVYELIDEIDSILKVPFDITPLQDAF